MRTVCFVTNEIYPEHKGGIGRMIHNIAVHNAASATPDRLFLLLSWQPPEARANIRVAFKGLAEVAFCPLSLGMELPWLQDYERSNPAQWHYGHAYRQSLMFYCNLRKFARDQGVTFDVIEFPDYGGTGLVALEAKAAGLDFESTELTVRLHSTNGIVAEHQPFYHAPTPWNANVEDMERQCLMKADRVIGHVAGVIEANRAFYGFSSDWSARCQLEFPPTLLEAEEQGAAAEAPAQPVRDFIFSSRLQPFKQPDLFIKASIRFLAANPDYTGRCRLISYGWDEAYITALKALIPPRLSDRITIETGLSAEARAAAVAAGIVVIPSNYESLCLFAFEASHLGAVLILNDACEAFGETSRWHEGRNCLTFDGTVEGLVRRMADALTVKELEKVDLTPSEPYWRQTASHKPARTRPHTLTLVGHGFRDREAVDRFVAAHQGMALTLLVSTDLEGGVAGLPSFVKVVPVLGAIAWPEDIARLVIDCATDLIAFMQAETTAEPAFFTHATAAFERRPELVAFGSLSRLTARDGSDRGIRIHAGCAPGVALQAREILPDGSVFRTATLRHLAETGRAFDGHAQARWYSDLCRELAFEHAPMIVAPHPFIHEVAPAVRQASTPAVDATLIDRLVRRTGSMGPVRALALKPLSGVTVPDDPRLEVSMILRGCRQVWPHADDADWAPVQYRLTEKDLLLHPLADTWTVAALPVTRTDVPEKLTVMMQHYGRDNPGVDIRLQAGTGPLDDAAVEALMTRSTADGAMKTPWHTLLPGEHKEITLPLPAGRPFDWVVAIARPTDGKTMTYGWTYMTRVWIA